MMFQHCFCTVSRNRITREGNGGFHLLVACERLSACLMETRPSGAVNNSSVYVEYVIEFLRFNISN